MLFCRQSKDLLSAKKETVRLMKSVYDRFGDSFTESVTTEDVERLFRDMSDKVQVSVFDLILREVLICKIAD